MSESFWLALLGISGTLLGAITGLAGNYWIQKQQRTWTIKDQRREWKKQYREKQIEPLQTFVRTWQNNPEIFYKITEQGYSIDLPRGSAWSIPDEHLRKETLQFLQLIAEYYGAVRAKSAEETRILTEIGTSCSQLEIEFERYTSDI